MTVVDRDQVRIRRWNSRHPPIYEPGLHDIVRVARDGGRALRVSNRPNVVAGEPDSGSSSSPDDNDTDVLNLAVREPNLFFTTDVAATIAIADVVLIAVNTPTKERGRGEGSATDLTAFEAVASFVAQHARPGTIIVEKSTVPVRTAQIVHEIVSSSCLPVLPV